jgi:hypothetical protein
MGLINDDHFRTGAKEVITAAIGLDEVGRDNNIRIVVEERLTWAARL